MIIMEVTIFALFLIIWYVSGEALLAKSTVAVYGWQRVSVALTGGIALFLGSAYILGLSGLEFLQIPIWIILLYQGFARIRIWKKYLLGSKLKFPAIIIIPIVLFSVSMVTSGYSQNGIILQGAHATDAVWNLSLVRELSRQFPPEHPGISGIPLRGYHFLYNLWLSRIWEITEMDPVRLYFWYIPILMSFLTVSGIYVFALKLTGKPGQAVWATMFSLLGGSFAYIVSYAYKTDLSWDGSLGITQPISLQVSPSFTLSLIFLFYSLWFFDYFVKTRNIISGIFFIILAGLLPGIKIYSAMILYGALGFYVVWKLMRGRSYFLIWPVIPAIMFGLVTFLPFNTNYGFLVYQFMWPPHRVMQGTLDFTKWELKRQTLVAMGSLKGQIKLEIIAFLVFLVGNLGSRIFGILYLALSGQKFKSGLFTITLLVMLAAFIPPLFFIQPIGAFNMIQMFWYFLFFAGILAGFGYYSLTEKMPVVIRGGSVLIIAVITAASCWEVITTHLVASGKSPTVDKNRLELYGVLDSLGSDGESVLEIPKLQEYNRKSVSDWAEVKTPQIPAFTNKREFLSGEVVQFKYNELFSNRPQLASKLYRVRQYPEFYVPNSVHIDAVAVIKTLRRKYDVRFLVSSEPVKWLDWIPEVKPVFRNPAGSIYRIL